MVNQGSGLNLKSDIGTVAGRKMAYLKLLLKEYIAKETLCWAMARILGLPVSQAHYVIVHSEDLEEPARSAGRIDGNSMNMAFGIEEASLSINRIDNRRAVERYLTNWKHALACGIFDDWIVNHDRIPDNLLYAGKNCFIMIDHDDALPSDASFDTHSISRVLKLLSLGKNELELHSLSRDTRPILEKSAILILNRFLNGIA